jgi:ketosteroid isomerase-like protein
MMRTREHAASNTVRRLLVAVDSGDVDAICEHLSDDVRFQFANADPLVGKPGFRAASNAVFDTVASSRHDILHLWEVEEDTVIVVMNVQYGTVDGRKLSLPCCNLFRVRDGEIVDYRVFMDANPVFAA